MATDSVLRARLLSKIKIDEVTGCWNWTAHRNKKLYGRMGWRGKLILSHRASYLMFVGSIPEGLLVCHKCDNPSCIYPLHLFLGTNQDNIDDAEAKGRMAKSLNRQSVVEIRERFKAGELIRNLASSFGVNTETIREIAYGLIWTSAGGPISDRRGPVRKLTLEQVGVIREKGSRGETAAAISREFGLNRKSISAILAGKNWKQ